VAPIGIVVDDLPRRADHEKVRGQHYLVVGDTWFQRTRGGYEVVREPRTWNRGHHYGWNKH
jgi:hypothetical protein